MAIILLKILNFTENVSHLFGGTYLNKGKVQAGKVRLSDKKVSPLGVGRLQEGQSQRVSSGAADAP